MRLLFIFLLLAGISTHVFAQEGQIAIVQDTSIQRVLNLYKTFAKEKRQVNGFRVQLASNNNRQTLLSTKANFLQQFPAVPAYIEYQPPQFKLRVGDFKTRIDADAFREEIIISFSSAFVVPDKIILEGIDW